MNLKKERHILNVSGGKDSSALAVYMRDRNYWRERLGKNINTQPEKIEMEYVFCDTREELEETYKYLDQLDSYLGKKIVRLYDDRGFKHWLELRGEYLPSPRVRWCTQQLKIVPFENYVGDDLVHSYIGIRADEDREGYVSSKKNIFPIYPFKEDGIDRDDVLRILKESGLQPDNDGLPMYYKWRTRSGCYFCFFQRKAEWIGLLENHPEKFEEAKSYEKVNEITGIKYTWADGESLEELSKPERIAEIKAYQVKALQREKKARPNRPLVEVLAEVLDDEDDQAACTICNW